jgi:sRNA-binding carbon storage regulator CsrA
MLKLTLKHQQRVFIGNDIIITVYTKNSDGTPRIGQCYLGIEAPLDIHILRENAKVKTPKIITFD